MYLREKRISTVGRSPVGLRARLLLLVLFAVIPAFGLIGYTAVSQRQHAALDAERDALNLVRLASREQSQLVAATRQLLLSLAQLPAVRQPGTDASCNRVLADLLKTHHYYTNFGVATLDGRIFCSALPMTQPVGIADRSYFRRAVQSREFGVGDYQTGRITGITAINFGYPVMDDDGNPQAVIFAALNLSWFNELIDGIELPEGSILTVVDSRGTILARYPDPDQWVGKSMRGSSLVEALLIHQRVGTAELAGFDGIVRLYAFAPLYDGPSAGSVYVSAGIPKAVVFAAAHQAFARNITLLLVAAALALIAAWVGSDIFVLRRVNALAAATRRLATGDLSARSGLRHGTEELGQLARSFDDMASALQRTNRALKTLSAGNRTLVRATDEPTLLSEMCRVIVEVGGYRLAWIDYAEQDEGKRFRPMAQCGFDGGLKTLSNVMQDATWADAERGPFGLAIRTGKPFVAHNIPTDPALAWWREEAQRRGYASGATFPIVVHGRAIGVLGICSREPDAFNAEELALLNETVEDLAFGISVLHTRTEHDRAHATIEHLARYDNLTGLPNYAFFHERAQHALSEAAARGQSAALFTIDLRRLREINSALGFHRGDLLLKEVGLRIGGVLDEAALVARPRGDEFAVLLPVRDVDHAADVAQRIMTAFSNPFVLGELNLDVSATVGIALFPQHGADAARLIRHADVARHQAKKSRKVYAFYDAEQDEDGTEGLALATELRYAIENEELALYYQPKLKMSDGRLCGVEALVRWIHPKRGMIAPDRFIELAEHTGLIDPLTDWVVGAALRQSSTWRKDGLEVSVAVNLSAGNLHDAELLNKIQRFFVQWGASGAWLELEITEGAMMQDPEAALEILRRLSDMGIALFIDDFGTGYSSLGYLNKLPVDAMKIDKSFVLDMLTDADSASIVRSTISLAHELDMKVVAEGVENAALWNRLHELGCDVAQGYGISKPLPADQFRDWWRKRARRMKQ
jgi:diguanylate cyclase (GGDEF)-like protein